MRSKSSTLAIATALALSLAACTSKDQTASAAAGQAEIELQQGRATDALRSVRKALAARDDVSDYWLLLARVDMALKDYGGAFDAYRTVIQFDRGNLEALQQLCQLGLAVHQPDQVDRYADQLLLLTPQDPMPLVMKGGAALQRTDSDKALEFAERVLKTDPHNISALILKGQILSYKGDYTGAARLIEASLDPANDQTSRLTFLRDLYARTGDVTGYARSVAQLAQRHPEDADMQFALADLLYQSDQPDEALAVLRRIMRRRPTDLGLAARAVELWLDQGGDALSPAEILQGAALPLEMRAAFAQYADETGRPALALRTLGSDFTNAEPDPGNSDAKAAAAFATGLTGHGAEALAQLQQILDVDPAQPRALLARARLRALTGNPAGALSDARQVVTDDARNITARLVLTDILLAQHQAVLAEANLREAVRARPEAVRPAARLVELLLQGGRRADAETVLLDLGRAAPASVRARRLLARYDVAMPPPPAALR